MRLAITFASVIIIFFSTMPAFALEINADSRVGAVTIYPNAALIKRVVSLDLQPGTHQVRLDDIVPQLDENSLSVEGTGSAKVKIYGAQIKKKFLTGAADVRVKNLEKKIRDLGDRIESENNNLALLVREESFLDSVKLFTGHQIPEDLVTKMPSVENLASVADFLRTNFKNVAEKKEKTRSIVRELSEERDALARELNQMRTINQKTQRSIVVDLECVASGKLDLTVSFLVYGVRWHPVYDARVAFDEGRVELTSFAMITQSTGEDWNGVALTISTSRPTVGGQMPELYPWYLNPDIYVGGNAGALRGRAPAAQKVAFMDQSKDFEADAPQEQAEMMYAEAQTAGVNVTYKISKPVSIKSDGTEHRIGVTAQTLPARFRYAGTPKLSPFAYLKTKVTNSADGQLLPGQVNVFLDGSYVGKSRIAKVLGPEEEFDLYLGADESVTIKRELIDKKTDDTLIGGIPSPSKTTAFKYKLTVENYKKRPISISLFDQIPVSQNDKIRVKSVQFKPEPNDKNYEDRQGVLRWVFDLAPTDKKEFHFSFVVEHPRDLPVGGISLR